MNNHFTAVRADTAGLSVFSKIAEHPLITSLADLLAAASAAGEKPSGSPKIAPNTSVEPLIDLCRRWAAFTGTFVRYAQSASFYDYLAFLTVTDDNVFSRNPGSKMLADTAAADLNRLSRIAAFDITKLGFFIAEMVHRGGLADAARDIEAEARAFWTDGENAANDAENAGIAAAREIFPRGANWSEALPRLAAYIADKKTKN